MNKVQHNVSRPLSFCHCHLDKTTYIRQLERKKIHQCTLLSNELSMENMDLDCLPGCYRSENAPRCKTSKDLVKKLSSDNGDTKVRSTKCFFHGYTEHPKLPDESRKYSIECNYCKAILSQVHELFNDLEEVKNNADLGICAHCSIPIACKKCKRCIQIARSFLDEKVDGDWITRAKTILSNAIYEHHSEDINMEDFTDDNLVQILGELQKVYKAKDVSDPSNADDQKQQKIILQKLLEIHKEEKRKAIEMLEKTEEVELHREFINEIISNLGSMTYNKLVDVLGPNMSEVVINSIFANIKLLKENLEKEFGVDLATKMINYILAHLGKLTMKKAKGIFGLHLTNELINEALAGYEDLEDVEERIHRLIENNVNEVTESAIIADVRDNKLTKRKLESKVEPEVAETIINDCLGSIGILTSKKLENIAGTVLSFQLVNKILADVGHMTFEKSKQVFGIRMTKDIVNKLLTNVGENISNKNLDVKLGKKLGIEILESIKNGQLTEEKLEKLLGKNFNIDSINRVLSQEPPVRIGDLIRNVNSIVEIKKIVRKDHVSNINESLEDKHLQLSDRTDFLKVSANSHENKNIKKSDNITVQSYLKKIQSDLNGKLKQVNMKESRKHVISTEVENRQVITKEKKITKRLITKDCNNGKIKQNKTPKEEIDNEAVLPTLPSENLSKDDTVQSNIEEFKNSIVGLPNIIKNAPTEVFYIPSKRDRRTLGIFANNENGVVKYRLSDPKYIKNGWTQLPILKEYRKQDIYRTKRILPEHDWFQRHKAKGILYYDSGGKLAEIYPDGCGRWYYQNGNLALDHYEAEEPLVGRRYVVYSSGHKDNRTVPVTVLACFDFLGNGVIFDEYGNERLKYNQMEGIAVDKKIAVFGRWQWHNLQTTETIWVANDPIRIKTPDRKTKRIKKVENLPSEVKQRQEMQEEVEKQMLLIEKENHEIDVMKKAATFTVFEIRPKSFKINEQFSLNILSQHEINLKFKDGNGTTLRQNVGVLLISDEILDSVMVPAKEVTTLFTKCDPKSQSVENLKSFIERTKVKQEKKRNPLKILNSNQTLRARALEGSLLKTMPNEE